MPTFSFFHQQNPSHTTTSYLVSYNTQSFNTKMVLLHGFYILSLVLYIFLQVLRKAMIISMALLSISSPSISALSSLYLSWVSQLLVGLLGIGIGSSLASETGVFEDHDHHDDEDYAAKNLLAHMITSQEDHNIVHEKYDDRKGMHSQEKSEILGLTKSGDEVKGSNIDKKLRMRPVKLVVPDSCPSVECFIEMGKKSEEKKEFEVEGRDFCLASKKGIRREVMEDRHGVMVDIMGDPKQAFFAVIDGHGGCAAADYVAENLGKNIMKALEHVGDHQEEHQVEQAIRQGYLVTDDAFLSHEGVSSGACAASVLLKLGELHVANVGDCRAVLSKKGVAHVLTKDHRLSREDERLRIENTGGFVHCRNGVWRLQGSLAVSRAIGDQYLKEWVISEPEIKKIPLTADCEFLIMASDGLWDKVDDQEAVDMVLSEKYSLKSCKKLVNMSSSRGNMDDITVMVINLQNFLSTSLVVSDDKCVYMQTFT